MLSVWSIDEASLQQFDTVKNRLRHQEISLFAPANPYPPFMYKVAFDWKDNMYTYNPEEAIRATRLNFDTRIEYLIGAARFEEAVELF